MSRRVTAGERTGRPWATRRTASTISAGGVSLRTNPAAPARRARSTCSSASKVVRMMTSGGWRRARRASVAASPSMAGMRMSIRDHVGGVPVDQGQHLGAVAGLGHHPDVGAPPSIITRPARTRGSSSTTSTPMVRGSDGVMPARVATRPAASRPRRWGRAPAARRPGRPARPARRGPARARDPRQPRPRARGRRGPAGGHRTEAAPARCRRPRRRGLVADLDGEALAGGAGQVDVHGRSRGVLAGVGQGLLHDPVGGAADQVGDGPADLLAQAHPHPGPARLGHQLPDVGEGGAAAARRPGRAGRR